MEVAKESKEQPQDSVQYAQQHLANERTYLAWIRTTISITGVGFLTTSLHFTIKISSNSTINTLAIFIGIFSCIIGIITGFLSTIQYTRKRKEIQDRIFNPSNHSIVFVSILFLFLSFLLFMYLTFLLFES
ncbi:DUF202 domain-containing protein (plasmid) [Bacillus sp. N447-1]|uniref:YidH family protein n=1 Tax=Bacillus sp. N447-1 TaxID=2789208 RepID=UPI001F60B2FB|nr:DUF202 domain-containing protein [Bacillus sp. N447-1]UNT71674.1 DUF202 domain-containing protein [Bacillus sp. N447-1]